jgi:hypothetical protein
MKKILYIAPHLSTGGLPQYLTKKIELLKNEYEIYVIEYEDITGGRLVIQKNKIIGLIGDRLKTIPWGGDKNIIFDFINEIKPDIIHFEEMPEYFMSPEIASQIYTDNRSYKIFETSHDSSFDCNKKIFQPDKFILVSKYQVEMLSLLNLPSEVVEYPIEYKERPNRDEALIKLGLDPEYKHVLHVGLFTPRKNQKEFFEYAKEFLGQKVQFHSIGNMADNFKFYWEPLLNDKPENLIWHGEKNNVDDYYAAMDLFLFTSRGTVNDKETMPLVIREAISWNIPTLIYNLPVYENYFDTFKSINYLNFDDQSKNVKLIGDKLKLTKTHVEKTAIIISTYPTSKNVVDLTRKAINEISKQGYDVILTSHAQVPTILQTTKYIIYDSNNVLTYHDYYSNAWFESGEYKMSINLKTEGNHIYHGPAVYTNYYNGINFAKNMGYKNAICFNFDMLIKDANVIPNLIKDLRTNKAVYNLTNPSEGKALRTVFFATDVDFFINHFNLVLDDKDYNDWKTNVGSESNGLENMFYHTLKDKLINIKILDDAQFYDMLSGCDIDLCSRVEYFNVLPVKDKPNQFAVWFSSNNLIDDREFKIMINKDGICQDVINIELKTNQRHFKVIDYVDGEYDLVLYENDVELKTIKVDRYYMDNKIKNNGELIIK